MPQLRINLNISRDEYLKWYSATAQHVITTALDGRKVRFPANVLQPFVTYSGVRGLFEIEFTESGKFRSIQRLG